MNRATPKPAPRRAPSFIDLETSIDDLANAALLVKEGISGAKAGPDNTAIISMEIQWGLVQVVERACALRVEFYALASDRSEVRNG